MSYIHGIKAIEITALKHTGKIYGPIIFIEDGAYILWRTLMENENILNTARFRI